MAPSNQYDQEASKPADKVRVIVSMGMIWNLQYDYIFLSPFSALDGQAFFFFFFPWSSLLKLDQGFATISSSSPVTTFLFLLSYIWLLECNDSCSFRDPHMLEILSC